MKKLSFKVNINAPASVVWHALWDDTNYRTWTHVFAEGSRAKSSWKEGDRIFFVDGNDDGMYSVIQKRVDNKEMVFTHLGILSKGVELPPDEKSKDWEGATEAYYLSEKDGETELVTELSSTGDHVDYFKDTFPKALEIVKQIAEKA